MSDERHILLSATVPVTQQFIDDHLTINESIAFRLRDAIVAEAIRLELTIIMETFTIEAVEGGYYIDPPQTWVDRLLRRFPLPVWVPTVAFEVTAEAE